jgi:hypothetical protein
MSASNTGVMLFGSLRTKRSALKRNARRTLDALRDPVGRWPDTQTLASELRNRSETRACSSTHAIRSSSLVTKTSMMAAPMMPASSSSAAATSARIPRGPVPRPSPRTSPGRVHPQLDRPPVGILLPRLVDLRLAVLVADPRTGDVVEGHVAQQLVVLLFVHEMLQVSGVDHAPRLEPKGSGTLEL